MNRARSGANCHGWLRLLPRCGGPHWGCLTSTRLLPSQRRSRNYCAQLEYWQIHSGRSYAGDNQRDSESSNYACQISTFVLRARQSVSLHRDQWDNPDESSNTHVLIGPGSQVCAFSSGRTTPIIGKRPLNLTLARPKRLSLLDRWQERMAGPIAETRESTPTSLTGASICRQQRTL